jgi:TolB-like protein
MKDCFSLASNGLNEEEEYKPQSTRTSADAWRKKRNAKEIDAIVRVCDSLRLSAVKILEKEYRKMKKAIVFLTIFFIGAMCYAQQTLVVPPATDRNSGFNSVDFANLTDFIINAIQRTGRFDVPDREALILMTEEHKFQLSDWADDRKSVQIGKALNANYIARAVVTKIDDVYLLTVRIIDVNTAKILGKANEIEFDNLRQARTKMDSFVKDVTANITVESTVYKIGDKGRGGGIVFYAENGFYMECSILLGQFNYQDALYATKQYTGGGFSDWRLPTKGELELIYKNLKLKGLGGLGNDVYWSTGIGFSFVTGETVDFNSWDYTIKDKESHVYNVRAVRESSGSISRNIQNKNPFLGVSRPAKDESLYTFSNGETGGARVISVIQNSAAYNAGLKAGDVIVYINEHIVRNTNLTDTVKLYNVGDTVTVYYYRDGKYQNTKVVLGYD